MKIIDKLSYAVWVYDNTCSSTVGFYRLTGADYKDALPHVLTFNRQLAGKVEVQDPMPWGQARKHTWQSIVDNGFDKEDFYRHGGPDGVNLSDDEVFNWWRNDGAENGRSSQQSKEDFLKHLVDLSVKEVNERERELPSGHKWETGPKYEADCGAGKYVMRDKTIRCTGCNTVAFWCEHDKVWKVDKNRDLTRSLKATCAEERTEIVEDAKSRVHLAEFDRERAELGPTHAS